MEIYSLFDPFMLFKMKGWSVYVLYFLMSDQNQNSLLVKRQNDNTSPDENIKR